ncbi:MAG: hypothetical protein Q8O31_03460 [Rhodocyclaceae bacterium]|nr:hypothetical protein [Rhodocyclaceae bacterium]
MKHAPSTPIPTPTLPLKGRELVSSHFKGRELVSSHFKGMELVSSPFKGEAGRGMGNVFHVNASESTEPDSSAPSGLWCR